MAKFQITGPDGGTYEVEAPEGASEQQVLDYVRKNAGGGQQMASLDRTPQFAPSDAPIQMPEQQPKGWGQRALEVASNLTPTGLGRLALEASKDPMDVAKSAGVGVGQGALGLASLPGNVEMLGRMAIDKGSEVLGQGNPNTTAGQMLPHYGDYKKAVEQYTGPFYEPKTMAGEYARTAGEFAPMAAGGGGPLAAAARVAVPAVLSETAGQMTKGTAAEPWARVGGALAGSVVPRSIGRAVSPARPDPERARQVAILEREGIQPTAGQRTGSESLMYRETNATSAPMAGRGPAALQERPLEQFTQAMMRRAGSNAPRATAEAVDDAFHALGNRFEALSRQASVSPLDPTLRQRIQAAVTTYERNTSEFARPPYVRNAADDLLTNQPPVMHGARIASTRKELADRSWQLRHTDHEQSAALRQIYEAIDDAVERGMPQASRGQYTQARDQYRNLLAIEKASTAAGANPATGLLTPQQMRAALVGQDRRSYARGQREMDEVTRAGNAIFKQMPNSGTPARLQAMGTNAALWAGAGAAATGNLAGLGAAALGPIGQAAYARGITSGPVQRYLGRQTNRPPMTGQGIGTAAPVGPILDDNDPRSRIRRAMGGQ